MTPIDEYLAKVEPAKREALERIRALAKQAVPEAEETISGHVIERLGAELHGYKTTRGAIRVPLETPIPERVLRAVIDCRLQAIRAADTT